MNDIQYIDTADKLTQLCQQLATETWVAVDTEFLREKTYYPKFCLLQLATPEWVACVDPLALDNLDELLEVLYQPKLLKVFHSCRQDLEIFFHLTGKLPQSLFDTQLAAPLLGFQENPGYGMLVSSLLNINLSKAHTRTDWSLRPLSKEQIDYAADDVIYLAQLYPMIVQKLQNLGRSDWLKNDLAQLLNPELYQALPENAWLRIKAKNKLTGKQLAILQAIAAWREQTAKDENKPRNWIMRDDLLIDLIKLQPQKSADLLKLRTMNERTVRRYGSEICDCIKLAKQQPALKLIDKNSHKKNAQQEAVLDVLMAVVRIRADENAINPTLLATRKDCETLLFSDEDCVLNHGWRAAMVGEELMKILTGGYLLAVSSEGITVNPL